MMRALIADDEPHLAAFLANRLAELWPELEIAASTDNGDDALRLIREQRPDLAFLDIKMPGLSGIEVAAQLGDACRVVFVTAYEQYAVTAFEREAVDYLLKPVTDERLLLTIDRLRRDTVRPANDLLVKLQQNLTAAPAHLRWIRASVGSSVRMVATEEVCYFRAADKYTSVVTGTAELLIRTPIRELASQLDPELFWQVHRGTLVNMRQVVAAERDVLGRLELRLRDRPEAVAVSRNYAHLFRQM
jgi:DNA-binding LytR/AlgR family response regulator